MLFWFFWFLFIRIFIHFFFRVHLTLVIYVIFNRDLIFDSWNVFQKKNFYQKSGKNFFFWNTFMIVDSKISFTFRSCIQVLNVERKLSKEKFNHLWRKVSSYKPALKAFAIFCRAKIHKRISHASNRDLFKYRMCLIRIKKVIGHIWICAVTNGYSKVPY